ncbi:hypothetical protein C8R43DRAFT_1047739 [Mycena crocata]|nr:hypothetical protein C8R43DRAFT_1047739 [Mycena crocata]
MSSSSRIVSVFGATGLQGSAVLEGLLHDGTFTPRAITRSTESEAAIKLKERGVVVVKADNEDKTSLVSALRGSEAVFAMTTACKNAGEEATQGKNIVDAAKEAGVKFLILSSTPSPSKLSNGKYKVFLYDDKAEVEEYLKSSGLANASLHVGGFLENFWTHNDLNKTPTGFNISIPKYNPASLQAFSWITHDVREAALALLKNYDNPSKSVSGKAYPVVTANMTYPELAALTEKTLGVQVTFTSIDSCGIPVYDDMYAVQSEYNGLYTATPVPNPDLVALGAKFATVEEFMQTEVKTRYS